MDDLIRDFVDEARDLLDDVEAALSRHAHMAVTSADLPDIRRHLHTIKGNAGLLSLPAVGLAAHEAETAFETIGKVPGAVHAVDVSLSALRLAIDGVVIPTPVTQGPVAAPAASVSVRVSNDRLDQINRDAFELALWRNRLADQLRETGDERWREPLQQLTRIANDLQTSVSMAMLRRIDEAWVNIPRMVRTIATDIGQEVRVEISGGETEVDRKTVDVIAECLVHLVRNAIAHGIEPKTERLRLGKPAEGLITISAWRSTSYSFVRIADDGRGLGLSPERVFKSGVSTAPALTTLAGRGEGLSIVARLVEAAGGGIEVDQKPGSGLAMVLRLPHAAAVVQCLIVSVSGQNFAVPYPNLVEVMRAEGANIADVPLRGRSVPLLDLCGALDLGPSTVMRPVIIGCESTRGMFAIRVDDVLQSQPLVVGPMPVPLAGLSFIGGVAVMGDGTPVIVLEPDVLAMMLGERIATSATPAAEQHPAASATLDVLTFHSGDGICRAVPVAHATRVIDVVVEEQGPDLPSWIPRIMPIDLACQPAIGARLKGLVVETGACDYVFPVEDLSVRHNALRIDRDTCLIDGAAVELLDLMTLLPAGDHSARPIDQNTVVLCGRVDELRPLVQPTVEAAGARLVCDAGDVQFNPIGALAVLVDLDDLSDGYYDAVAQALRPLFPMRISAAIGLTRQPDSLSRARAAQLGISQIVGVFDRRRLIALINSLRATEAAA